MADQYDNNCGPLLSPRLRQYIDHRTGYTNTIFASPVEGDSSPPDIDSYPPQAKTDMKQRSFSDALQAFTYDMRRIEKFYTSILQDREAFRHVLHRNELVIESLYHEIERWKHLSDYESERMDEIEQAWKDRQIKLQDILSPLYNGLQDSTNPEQEFNERIDSLKTICDKELKELLDYIMTTSEQNQINQSELKNDRDGWNWQKQATEYLEKQHRLVDSGYIGHSEKRKYFTLTERGEAVYEAFEALLQSSYLDEWQQEGDSREKAGYKALSEPHNVGV